MTIEEHSFVCVFRIKCGPAKFVTAWKVPCSSFRQFIEVLLYLQQSKIPHQTRTEYIANAIKDMHGREDKIEDFMYLLNFLEFLETMGVPVLGYRTDTFPAFYTSTSDLPLDTRVDDTELLSHILSIHWKLNTSGVLIANPIPKEYSIASDCIHSAISASIRSASQNKITGKELTPFLLKKLEQETLGKSLTANIALLKNNVRLGAELAKKFNCST